MSEGTACPMATVTARSTKVGLPPGPSAGRFERAARFHRDPARVPAAHGNEFGDAFTLRLAVAGPMVVFTDPAVAGEVIDLSVNRVRSGAIVARPPSRARQRRHAARRLRWNRCRGAVRGLPHMVHPVRPHCEALSKGADPCYLPEASTAILRRR